MEREARAVTGRDTPRPPVCTGVVAGRGGVYQWPCVLAEGHEGGHRPSEEWASWPKPFDEMTPEELRLAVHLECTRRVSAERRMDEMWTRHLAGTRTVVRLATMALDKGRGGGKHDETCHLRHVRCLARKVLERL